MQHKRYSKDNIKEFRRNYKCYRWINNLLILAGILFIIYGKYLLPSNTDSYGYYNGSNYNYICNLNDLFSLFIFFPCFILVFIIYQRSIKIKLKDEYNKYKVSCFNRNINKRKGFMIKIISIISLIITFALLTLFQYNDLTHIVLSDTHINIKYDKNDINGSYSLNDFSEWSTSVNNFDIQLSLSDARSSKFSSLIVNLDGPSKYQEKLLMLMDEKTDCKFHLYDKTQYEIKNSMIR